MVDINHDTSFPTGSMTFPFVNCLECLDAFFVSAELPFSI